MSNNANKIIAFLYKSGLSWLRNDKMASQKRILTL